MTNQRQEKTNTGFSIVEILLVVSIVIVLMVVLVVLINPVGRVKQSRIESAKAKMKTLANAIQTKQTESQKVLGAITGSGCTPCSCRCVDARTNTTCVNNATNAWAKVSSKPMGRDPWGNVFTFDENELEISGSDCRYDSLISAGPDHIQGATGCSANSADDISYQIPHFYCP